MCRVTLRANGGKMDFVFTSSIIANKFVDMCFDTFDRDKENLVITIKREEDY